MRAISSLTCADVPAGALAYGHRRLLESARAMVARPTLLLFDEPAAGLNVTEAPAAERSFWPMNAYGRLVEWSRYTEGALIHRQIKHAEIIVDVEKPEAFELRQLLVDEVDQIADELTGTISEHRCSRKTTPGRCI